MFGICSVLIGPWQVSRLIASQRRLHPCRETGFAASSSLAFRHTLNSLLSGSFPFALRDSMCSRSQTPDIALSRPIVIVSNSCGQQGVHFDLTGPVVLGETCQRRPSHTTADPGTTWSLITQCIRARAYREVSLSDEEAARQQKQKIHLDAG